MTKLSGETLAQRAAAVRPQIEALAQQIAAHSADRVRVAVELQKVVDEHGLGTDASSRDAAATATEGPTPRGTLTFKYVPIESLQQPGPDDRVMSLSIEPQSPADGFRATLACIDALLATGANVELQIGVFGDPAKMQRVALDGTEPLAGPAVIGALFASTPSLLDQLYGAPRRFNLTAVADRAELLGNWQPDRNIDFQPSPLAKVLAEHPGMFSDDPFFRG